MICRVAAAAKSQLGTFKKFNIKYIFSNLDWQIYLSAILDYNFKSILCRVAAAKSQLDINEYKVKK